jgi:hypothetical protein
MQCAPQPSAPAPPPGLALVVRAHAGCALARDVAASGSRTAIGAAAARAATALCACAPASDAWASASDGALASALGSLRCGTPSFALPIPAGALAAFSDDAGARGSVIGTGADTIVTFESRGPIAALAGVAQAPHLSDARALVHVGVRTDPASLRALLADPHAKTILPDVAVAALSSLLDGAWELAIYQPEGEDEVHGSSPLPVLRLGARAPGALLDALALQLEQRFHLRRADASIAGREALCFPEARFVPGLAPCALVDGDSLVVGFNPRVLERALAAPSDAHNGVALDRFGAGMPWQRIDIASRESAVDIHFVSEPRP